MKDLFNKVEVAKVFAVSSLVVSFMVAGVFASNISEFSITINPGTLAIDIVNTTTSYSTVASPTVTFSSATASFSCGSATGTLGTTTQAVYVSNPDAADNGWTASMAATGGATSYWDGTVADMDFNDTTGSGCSDGADTDSLKGRLTVNPSVGSVAVGQCGSCTTTNVSAGSSSAFNEGVTNSITLFSASAGSNDIGDWTLQGVSLTQTIPAEQPADSLTIDMTLSVVAS